MKFIVIEGFECSGKTTTVKLLEEGLISNGYKVKVVRNPGTSETSEIVRDLVLNAKVSSSIATELMFLSAMLENVNRYIFSNNDYDFIIFDRYVESHICYNKVDYSTIGFIKKLFFKKDFIVPDFTIMLTNHGSLESLNRKENKDEIEKELLETNYGEEVMTKYAALSYLYITESESVNYADLAEKLPTKLVEMIYTLEHSLGDDLDFDIRPYIPLDYTEIKNNGTKEDLAKAVKGLMVEKLLCR